MGLFNKLKRKKQLTPESLRETMSKLQNGLSSVLAFEDASQRENEAKILLIEIEQTKTTVQETLAKVESNIEDLMGKGGWWATQEVVRSDLEGLRKGRETLLVARDELEKMSGKIIDIFKGKGQVEPEQNEPGE